MSRTGIDVPYLVSAGDGPARSACSQSVELDVVHVKCETVITMKNITVSVDDDTYRRARVVAAQRDTSVSALVREFLNGLPTDTERPADWDTLWAMVDSWGAEVGERPTRSRTYDGRA